LIEHLHYYSGGVAIFMHIIAGVFFDPLHWCNKRTDDVDDDIENNK